MAITFLNGTLNPASTQKARDVRQAWASAFSGISGWTLVDHNYVNGTIERSVLVNSAGFVLGIANSTTLTTLDVDIWFAQSYTAATHTFNNVGFGDNTSAYTSNASGFSGVNENPSTLQGGVNIRGIYSFTATASQTAWTAHIESDHAIVSFKDGSAVIGRALYFGRFDSLVTNTILTDTYNFCMIANTGTSNRYTGSILHSLGNESQSTQHAIEVFTPAYTSPVATLSYADKYSATPTLGTAAPVYITRKDNPTTAAATPVLNTTASTNGWLRGKLKNVVASNATGALYGDILVVGTKQYYYVGGIADGSYAGNTIYLWAAIN